MPLKTRITLAVMLVLLLMWAAFTAIFYLRELEQKRHYDEALLQTQRIAWTKLQADSVRRLENVADELLATQGWQRAWRDGRPTALAGPLQAAAALHPGWRFEVFDQFGQLRWSSATEPQPDAMVDSAWLAHFQERQRPDSGLSSIAREKLLVVVLRRFGAGGHKGVLAVGLEVSTLLGELSAVLAGESSLLSLRGREIAGMRSALPENVELSVSAREPQVRERRAPPGRHLLEVVLPVSGVDRRNLGALLVVHDVTAAREVQQQLALTGLVAGLLLMMVAAAAVFFYLRRALRPLERSVQVLGALSRGDLRMAPFDDDQALADEAGQIARGVAALRDEMLSLQMLREERVRNRQQQERLIRRQLKLLAESLDESSRAEILRALEPEQEQPTGEDFSENELAELARILGRMSGLVTHQQERLVRLLRELRQAMERQAVLVSLQQELEIARNMQLSILPRHPPSAPGVEVTALMIPANEVGGDFYDYFLIDHDRLAMVVADVSGKGIPAAFFMAISRTLLKSNALFLRQPAQVITRLNDQLCAENEQMMFVTAFFGVLNLRTGVLDYVNAGHNPPIMRRQSGEACMLPRSQNVALAVLNDVHYQQGQVVLGTGDVLLLYTDGVTEAIDPAGAMFGEERLVQVVLRHAAGRGNLPQELLQAVREFESGRPQVDDITCVALRFLARESLA